MFFFLFSSLLLFYTLTRAHFIFYINRQACKREKLKIKSKRETEKERERWIGIENVNASVR